MQSSESATVQATAPQRALESAGSVGIKRSRPQGESPLQTILERMDAFLARRIW